MIRGLGQQPYELTEKTISKELIYNIKYNPFHAGLNTTELPDNIEQVKAQIKKFNDKIKQKLKIKISRNDKITLGYIEEPK